MKKSLFLQISVIIILGFAVYANSFKGGFVWDDNVLVRDNAYINDWNHLPEIFSKNIASGAQYHSDAYRPLQIFTYLIDNYLWKKNLIGYHFTNVLLHVLAGLSIYWLVSLLFTNRTLAWLTGILFIVHPVQTEAVSYISGRGDLLSALFMLLCLIFYIKQLAAQNKLLFIMMLGTYVSAILSKENAVVLPGLILLYHYAFKKKVNLKLLLPLAGSALLYFFLRASGTQALGLDLNVILKRIPGFFAALAGYFKVLFLPRGLHMEYGNKLFAFNHPKALIGLLLASLLLIYVFKKRNTDKLLFFSAGWFFIALLPHSSVYPVCTFYMAEHWLYFSSAGFFLVLSNYWIRFYNKNKLKALSKIFIICFISLLSFLSIRQNRYWNDQVSLYKRTLKFTPDSFAAYYNLCQAYMERGDYDKALTACSRCIAVRPDYPEAYCKLGEIYRQLGNTPQEQVSYSQALKVRPDFALAYDCLCRMYVDSNKNAEAVENCKKSVQLNPGQSAAYYNMGRAYDSLGEKQNAIEAYLKALHIDPDFLEAYNNLAAIYADTARVDEAIQLWNKIVQINPGFMTAHFNLAVFYFKQQKTDLAIKHCDKVIELGGRVDAQFLELLKPYRK